MKTNNKAKNVTPQFVVKDSGARQKFATGAQRDIQEGKGRFDLLPVHALTRLAQHFENGAKKYNDDNWRKGIPLNRYLDSAIRHLFKFADGMRDEDHAIAAAWNLLCLVETERMIQLGLLPNELNTLRIGPGPTKAFEAKVKESPVEDYPPKQ